MFGGVQNAQSISQFGITLRTQSRGETLSAALCSLRELLLMSPRAADADAPGARLLDFGEELYDLLYHRMAVHPP